MNIIWTVLILGVMIFIHELGHFISARIFGVKVNEFALGMGPTLIKKQGKETKYAIRLFPVGGFVSMEGEEEESDDERSFSSKSPLRRISVIIAGVTMNVIFAIIALIIVSF